MSDPRVTDAIRNIIPMLEKQSQELVDLRADNAYIKNILREIKKSVIRKSAKVEEDNG